MNIRETIEDIEHKWLKQAYVFCQQCFSSVYLPSHDETHPLRVWHFAKDLILHFHPSVHPFTPSQVEGILLAVMLHDTGMSETLDFMHGHASRQLAETFFTTLPAPPALAREILAVIEKHDDKSYTTDLSYDHKEDILLSILSLADDMDAFGALGVFRYYEIYVLRGIAIPLLADKVIPNLYQRYQTLAGKLKPWPEILHRQRKRYLTTRLFFEDLQEQNPGAFAVIDIFEQRIRIPRKKPEEAIPEILKNNPDKTISVFFLQMKEELSSFSGLTHLIH